MWGVVDVRNDEECLVLGGMTQFFRWSIHLLSMWLFIWEFVSFLWLVTELIGGRKKCMSHGFSGTGGQTLGHLVGPGIAQGHWILGGLVPQMVDYSYL